MAKKSSYKNLKELAASLPKSYTVEFRHETITREEALKRELVIPENLKHIDKLKYTTKVSVPVNHLARLKQALTQGGVPAVEKYVEQINSVNAAVMAKAEEEYVAEAQSKLDAIDTTTDQSAPTFDEGEE